MFSLGFVEVSHSMAERVGLLTTALYLAPVLIIGYLGIMNLFVAILVETFTTDVEDAIEEEAEHAPSAVHEEAAAASAGSAGEDGDVESGAPCCSTKCVVSHPLFEHFVLTLIVLSSLCLAVDTPRLDLESDLAHLLYTANEVFTALFTR